MKLSEELKNALRNPRHTSANLYGFGLTGAGLLEAIEIINANPNITKVNLSSNLINDTDAEEIAKLQHVTDLDLSKNVHLGAGAVHIVKNATIQNLDLSRTNMSTAIVREIASCSMQSEIIIKNTQTDISALNELNERLRMNKKNIKSRENNDASTITPSPF